MKIEGQQMRTLHFAVLAACLVFFGCANAVGPGPTVVKYQSQFRQTAPEPVYNRLMWSYLPEPTPAAALQQAPYFAPKISFELPNSNLEEAIVALAQTIGYEPLYPPELGGRRVSITTVAHVDEILAEIARQAQVRAVVNHRERYVKVLEQATQPQLPE